MLSDKYHLFKYLFIAFFTIIGADFVKGQNKEIIYISGTDNNNTKKWDFYCSSGRNSESWTTINVPSQWEQEGFGNYDYGRDYRTYGKKFTFSNESGIYKTNFDSPQEWANKQVFIVFEGVMTDAEVKINDTPAGPIHQGAFYRFKYNITDLITLRSSNELKVSVNKMSADPSVNRAERYADYWIFGGIFRPVYLEIVPQNYIDRVSIKAEANGEFSMNIFPVCESKKLKIKNEVIDSEGKVIDVKDIKVSGKDTLITLKSTISNIKQWTSETPNLYTAKVTLTDGDEEIYTLSQKFGFRTIEIRKKDGIYINGTKVKFKGVNRHAFWPESGRCLNPNLDLKDVQLMKEMNLNAVRCSHYPPDQTFLDYCDSLGLYVLDELAGWQNSYSTEAGRKLVKEMVIRDANHPSIIFWSNGNEGGTNPELDDDFALYDHSNRPVIHAHHKPGNDYNGIDCNHYENYYSSKKILDGDLIYMPTEFLHGQDDGGIAAGLYDFWELFWNSEKSAGGFLWVFSDEGIVRTDFDGFIDVNRVNAPDGILGPHREKEASYFALKEIYSPIKINLDKLPNNPNITIPVENRYHFTNLQNCKFEWQLVNFVSPQERTAGHIIKNSGKIISPNILPVTTGSLSVNLPADFQQYDALYLKAFDPFNEEIFCWSWKINGNSNTTLHLVEKELNPEEKAHLEKLKALGVEEDNILPIQQKAGDKNVNFEVNFNETDSTISMKASGIGIEFSKTDGTILNLSNDFGLSIPFNNGPVLVSGSAKVSKVTNYDSTNTHIIKFNYTGDLKYIKWTMHSSGWLEMKYEYQVKNEQYFTGITFDFPESDIIGVKWLGDGPRHVWKNRTQGGKIDVYERMYNNILPGDNNWQYPQFKGYYANISWMEFNSDYGKFIMAAKEENLFVRLFDYYGLSGPVNYPVLPKGNISFLDAIPPIGTKLAMGISNDTWNLGPAGELSQMEKPIKRTLYFYFGLLQ